MRRVVGLGLVLVLGGCTAPGPLDRLANALPLFRADPPALALKGPTSPKTEDLQGAQSVAVTSLLGAPELVRREGEAEIWHYSGQSCRLMVFLYTPDEAPAKAERKSPGVIKAAALQPEPIAANAAVRFVAAWPEQAQVEPCLASVAARARFSAAARN